MPRENDPNTEPSKPLRPQDDTNPVKDNPRMRDEPSRSPSSQERGQRR